MILDANSTKVLVRTVSDQVMPLVQGIMCTQKCVSLMLPPESKNEVKAAMQVKVQIASTNLIYTKEFKKAASSSAAGSS